MEAAFPMNAICSPWYTLISVTGSGHIIGYKKRRLPYKEYEKWPYKSQKKDSSFILYGHSPSHYWECITLGWVPMQCTWTGQRWLPVLKDFAKLQRALDQVPNNHLFRCMHPQGWSLIQVISRTVKWLVWKSVVDFVIHYKITSHEKDFL